MFINNNCACSGSFYLWGVFCSCSLVVFERKSVIYGAKSKLVLINYTFIDFLGILEATTDL